MIRRLRPLLATLCTLVAAVLLPAVPAAAAGDVRGGDLFRTGAGYRCMVSFSVVGQVTPFNGFLTAGHCGQAGDAVYTPGGELMGYFAASSFPGNDYALVQLNPGWTPRGEVRTGAGTVAVKGATSAAVGASVCKYGSTTGWRCGTIQAKNMTVHYPEGVIYGLTRTSVCAEAGDSAAPFMSGNQAQGILVGSSGNCSSGGTSYFQPVGEALSAYGVRLVTG
ncbi:S1 family peptidase [Micromonospora sp. CPCC 206060]|uniref:S1 family peptidase n=1 Tax=Micromonospora sp. CPCC 206060 TaxID=3122406 RepID=UPI002FF15BFD